MVDAPVPNLASFLAPDQAVTNLCEEYSHYWRTVVETMADGLMVVDPAGIIVAVNPALEELSGYAAADLLGRPCSILNFDTCPQVRAEGQGRHCGLFKDGAVRRKRCLLRRRDGRAVPLLKNAAVLKDGQGRVLGGVESLTDLTEVAARDEVITQLRQELAGRDGFRGLLGQSPLMRRVFALLESAAQSQAPVVITGESGTGKELAAQAIHDLGPRAKGPFIRVNCAALNESLLESELFGHVKGAFTGAERGRVGRFEAASGGDIFLDEIGDLPLATQVKLLRVLQEGEIERVGDHRPIKLDVRVITATNQDLARLMAAGRFREDLYYRIAAIPVPIPPLRERREDIPLLAEAFLERIRLKTGKPLTGLAKEALEMLLAHDWPGNVRELINALEYAFVLCPEGLIRPEHLPARIAGGRAGQPPAGPARLDQAEAERLTAALERSGGNRTEAARLLGLSRVTLWKKLKRLGLETSS